MSNDTAYAVTNEQIAALRVMALEVGDEALVEVCNRALGIGPRFDSMAHFLARARCANAIAAARRAALEEIP